MNAIPLKVALQRFFYACLFCRRGFAVFGGFFFRRFGISSGGACQFFHVFGEAAFVAHRAFFQLGDATVNSVHIGRFAYLDDAYALATTYLRSLTPESLDDIVDESWDPPVTRAVRLASVIDDAAQHSGQAIYTRRLLGLPG